MDDWGYPYEEAPLRHTASSAVEDADAAIGEWIDAGLSEWASVGDLGLFILTGRRIG